VFKRLRTFIAMLKQTAVVSLNWYFLKFTFLVPVCPRLRGVIREKLWQSVAVLLSVLVVVIVCPMC